MERLTKRNEDGTAFYPYCFLNDTCGGMGASEKCNTCGHSIGVCERLADYEDAGLTPEEIVELKEFYSSPLNTAVPGVKFILNEDGVADLYDDTYDITIHCENKDQNDKLMERLSRCSWIPIEERLPENHEYILVSFGNFSVPDIARYERDDEGGAFYPGDEDYTYTSVGLFVNAWMPLPEPYREEE